MKVLVDGLYLGKKKTGVQRFTIEIVNRLALYDDIELDIIVPIGYKIINHVPDSNNVKVVFYGKQTDKHSRIWEQISLKKYAKKNNLPLLCLGNITPIYTKSYLTLHDVTTIEKNSFKQSFWFRFKHNLFNRLFLHKCKTIFTDSFFSKERILYFYPKLKKIEKEPIVVCCGYEHMDEIVEQPVNGLPSDFYFAVGSLNTNKNFKYIIELAKHNPDKQFVIAGGAVEKWSKEELDRKTSENCKFVGYISDEQLKWLYANCKGFILPSLYEGFGLPPLEALACGCKNLYLSNIEVFREIYGNVATFFDPYDYKNTLILSDCNIELENIKTLLEKYSWNTATKIIYETLERDYNE